MTVAELILQLGAMPGDAHISVMFPTGNGAYDVNMVELMELRDGRKFCIIEITADAPLRAV
jgi:hypothetical protein